MANIELIELQLDTTSIEAQIKALGRVLDAFIAKKRVVLSLIHI